MPFRFVEFANNCNIWWYITEIHFYLFHSRNSFIYSTAETTKLKDKHGGPRDFGAIALSYPPCPRVRVRATVKHSAVFFHVESSITIEGVRKCNSAEISLASIWKEESSQTEQCSAGPSFILHFVWMFLFGILNVTREQSINQQKTFVTFSRF